jgi:hypothetical protein
MLFKNFEEFISVYRNTLERSEKLYKLGIDLIDYSDEYHSLITRLFKEVYGEEGYEWFGWFCHESDFGERKYEGGHGASDADGNPICYDLKSLWEMLEEIRLRKIEE